MNDLEFVGKSALFEKERVLAIADLHLGFEQALNEKGIFLPRQMYKEILRDLKEIFDRTGKLKEIVILGDLKHEFSSISPQEWKDILDLLDYLAKNCGKLVLVKGNHDTILEPIARKKNIEVIDFYIKGRNCFMHGHKIFKRCLKKGIKRIILGHKHPAITLRRAAKQETYKCFLVGKWENKEIVILPSFFPLVDGSDIYVEDTNLSIPLKINSFDVYAVGDKIYDLGKARTVGKIN